MLEEYTTPISKNLASSESEELTSSSQIDSAFDTGNDTANTSWNDLDVVGVKDTDNAMAIIDLMDMAVQLSTHIKRDGDIWYFKLLKQLAFLLSDVAVSEIQLTSRTC